MLKRHPAQGSSCEPSVQTTQVERSELKKFLLFIPDLFLVSCFLDVGDSPACLDPDALLLVVGECTPEAIRTRR